MTHDTTRTPMAPVTLTGNGLRTVCLALTEAHRMAKEIARALHQEEEAGTDYRAVISVPTWHQAMPGDADRMADLADDFRYLAEQIGSALPDDPHVTDALRAALVAGATPETAWTHPDVLFAARDGADWADPETDPTRIDWAGRQARAAVPHRVVDGRPVSPGAPTGIRYGRGHLGHWGEQQCADALVLADLPDDELWVLMVERRDRLGWALPGGYVDPGESPADAAVRELHEEAALSLPGARWTPLPARYVPDPRATDEAWMVTTVCVAQILLADLPEVRGLDDAVRAEWVRADSYDALTADLGERLGGRVFAAHVELLREALAPDGLLAQP
ncbi:NUDIX domain-containing protein [Actinomadura atramentaria]|uniref:NUDIX domain-containing protein n=1 Tax=Actinomadura atramentaria TaxID=1990 RepID=UPI00037BB650|nr:NUDIX domain-containing protein [Actinomadura atramentaria]